MQSFIDALQMPNIQPIKISDAMLLLLFYVNNDLYAIETSTVVEIIPRIELRKIHHVPDYVAGLFNYHGKIVPVIDICHLIRGTSSRLCLSTRIIIVKYTNQYHEQQYLGLIAEKITETLNQSETDFIDSGILIKEAPYLGEILVSAKGMIQVIHLEQFLADAQNSYLATQQQN